MVIPLLSLQLIQECPKYTTESRRNETPTRAPIEELVSECLFSADQGEFFGPKIHFFGKNQISSSWTYNISFP